MPNLINNIVNRSVSNGSTFSSSQGFKKVIDLSFQTKEGVTDKDKEKRPKEDTILQNSIKEKLRINWEKATAIPLIHVPRGLGGAPDYTFYESLETAKVPYYVGGPVLAALFNAGVMMDNLKSGKAAKNVSKHMALGVGLYYLGAIVAKSIVTQTIKLARGIDLNYPYAKAVSQTTNDTGVFKKDVEYHKVFESADFTRWDLLYNKEANTPDKINENYAKIAKRYGIKAEDTNDIDTTVKPLVKKTIIMGRAWQYALTSFFVTLGIGLANQPTWKKSSGEGFVNTIKNGIFGNNKTLKDRAYATKIVLKDYIAEPFIESFKQLWNGHNKTTSIAGKAVIGSTVAATLLAILMLVTKTSAKHHKVTNSGSNDKNEVRKNG